MKTLQHLWNHFNGVLILAFVYPLSANTERDIGPMPQLSQVAVNRWTLFYTNVERVKEGLLPLGYDPILEKAANYIADYCATKLNTISHDINEPGMQSMSDRIRHFGGKFSSAGENLTIAFRTNSEDVRFYRKSDDKGDYKDFESHTIYWRNERQLAYRMVDDWMHSSGHRANILSSGYAAMGAGVAWGSYSGSESAYGAQVFTGNSRLDFTAFKWVAEKKEISYKGNLAPVCFSIDGDTQPVSIPIKTSGTNYVCTQPSNSKGFTFGGLFDVKTRITYPIIRIP